MSLPEHHYLSASLSLDETSCAKRAFETLAWDDRRAQEVFDFAAQLAGHVRQNPSELGMLETMLQRFPIDSDEGNALMTMAESLLRIPDSHSAHALIKDRFNAAQWQTGVSSGLSGLMKFAPVGLGLGHKAINSPFSTLAMPALHQSVKTVVKSLGSQFVLGETIQQAQKNAKPYSDKNDSLSYDMLGEAARTFEDAQRYFDAYKNALMALDSADLPDKPLAQKSGISVKLSALHPRYESLQSDFCLPLLKSRLMELCQIAAALDVPLTIDAEESERLVISLELFDAILSSDLTKEWNGFGLAVQAYQKRALDVIDWLNKRTQKLGRNIQVRLVKGAYWDREIKHAQTLGLRDYPVFTRKHHTDLNYLACAHKLLTSCDHIYPMFATHNAYSIAAIYLMAKDTQSTYEFQRLFGMGGGIYSALSQRYPDIANRIYAPVGPHEDLLAYLVRRMLENGANSSFVNQLLAPDINLKDLLFDPVRKSYKGNFQPHPNILPPNDIYRKEFPVGRKNSKGFDLNDEATRSALEQAIAQHMVPKRLYDAYSIINGKHCKGSENFHLYSPNSSDLYNGRVWYANQKIISKAVHSAQENFLLWRDTPSAERRKILRSYADLLEKNSAKFYALLIREAGKTIADAQAEIREAIDFCRYYANQLLYVAPEKLQNLPGPTGEENLYTRHGRGVFACISPWNFPLAIYTGQIAAALAAGNCVVAKPAEQTPLIATFAAELWHKAGLPKGVLNLIIGDGFTGEALVNHPDINGVAFTGSVAAARSINQSLAMRHGAIVPLIAETGGLNTMVVDSSALLEQVIDDVVISAFGSAGQRCSALRIVTVQDDVADEFIRLLRGKMEALQVGDPSYSGTDVGPIIDNEARDKLRTHALAMDEMALPLARAYVDPDLERTGIYFAPRAYEILSLHAAQEEVFGPILHVLRYKPRELNEHLDQLNALGYGLTLGIHSRIPSFAKKITKKISAGNVYVNRTMIGAVVGSQPFGGHGLSGTGPKAGGPDYLLRFMNERSISTDITAAGGNASLLSLQDDA